MAENSILEAAMAAYTAGLCPIRAATDGSKRPHGTWKHRQSERQSGLDDVIVEFKDWPNLGLVCGAVSDRLICLEFEGRFMAEWEAAQEYMDGSIRHHSIEEMSLFDEWFKTWIDGYCERTPSGGIHVLIHYGGEGPVPGNTKIALNADNETLIETRGEGGFVIVAPSNGTTHDTGKAWSLTSGNFETIAWVQPEEYELIIDLLGDRFDKCPPAPAPAPQARRPRLTLVQGEGWIAEELSLLPPIERVLADVGWTYIRTEPLGSLWKRPGKVDQGHSARVNQSGRLIVFSSSTYLSGYGRQTFDALDVILAARRGIGGGRSAPTLDERTEYLRAHRDARMPARAEMTRPPAPTDPTSEEYQASDLSLPPEFWTERPMLTTIRDAALSRFLSPDGVLGAFLSCYATTIPMSIVVPAIVGGRSCLNTYCALVANSGGGKTMSINLAMELLDWSESEHQDVLLNRSLRSGEGLVNLAMIPKTKDNPDPGYRQAVQVCFDEGGTLAAQAQRTGSTTIPYLNTAWTGSGTVGGARASEHGSFPAALVRVCAVMGVQFGVCANLFTGEIKAMGFPQRLLFFGLENPAIADLPITEDEIPTIDPLGLPYWSHGEFARRKYEIQFPGFILREVRTWMRDRQSTNAVAKIDAHKMLVRLRTTALLALADGRMVVNAHDWVLAGCISATSIAVRTSLLSSLHNVTLDRAILQGEVDTVRQDAADQAWLNKRAERIARHLQGVEEGFTLKDIKSLLASYERPRRDEIVALAIARGFIVFRDGRYFAR